MGMSVTAYADHEISKVSEVWGRAIKVRADQSFHGYRYFIYYVKADQRYAYPIAVKNKQQEKMINQLQGKLAKVSGSVHATEIINDGAQMNMVYFVPATISPLTLDTLGLNKKTTSSSQNPEMISTMRAATEPGGIRISSPAAEVTVYTAAALLIGNILKDYLTRK